MPKKKIRRRLKLEEQTSRAEFLEVEDLSPETEDVKAMNQTMTWLIDRKKQYFDRHKRHILEFRLSDFGDRYGLQVFSVDVPGNQ